MKQMAPSMAQFSELMHMATSIPRSWTRRTITFACLFTSFLLLMLMSIHPSISPTVHDLASNVKPLVGLQPSSSTIHPVEQLHKQWTQKFEKKVAGQSQTLRQAVKEYQRRYHRQPPAGFDIWFQYATKNKYILVDEFDTLADSLESYWRVEPQQLRSRIELTEGAALVHVTVQNGNATQGEFKHDHVGTLTKWINRWIKTDMFPDMNLTFSVMDEPRVNAAYTDESSSLNLQKNPEARADDKLQSGSKREVAPPEWLNLQHRHAWPYLADSCPDHMVPKIPSYDDSKLPFLDKAPSHQDFCESVGMLDEHGFFQFPASLDLLKTLVPLFSQCAPTRFNDLLYPSPYYLGAAKDEPDELEPDWNLKFKELYWAGSSTGGWHIPEHWTDVQRAGIAVKTSAKNKSPVTLLRQIPSRFGVSFKPFKSTWSTISHYFHIRITNIVQCLEEACEEMEKVFGEKNEEPSSNSQRYKYVLDIDGNAYSGRFLRLLKSKSAVLKSTIFREWHDDLLFPWVHYIPVSTSANELGEMMRYLATENRGDEIGKSIANAGQSWTMKVLRPVDLEIYFLRMIMEYGRLVSDDRDNEATSFVLDADR